MDHLQQLPISNPVPSRTDLVVFLLKTSLTIIIDAAIFAIYISFFCVKGYMYSHNAQSSVIHAMHALPAC